METAVDSLKLTWIFGYIQGIQIMGEQCDWEKMLTAIDRLEMEYKKMMDHSYPITHVKETLTQKPEEKI